MELARKIEALERASVPADGDDPSAIPDSTDRLVQRWRRAGNLDDDVGSSVTRQCADLLRDALGGCENYVSACPARNVSTRLNPVNTDHQLSSGPACQLRHEQAYDPKPRDDEHISQRRPGVEQSVQGGVQVRVQHP